jgi:hypothetical protein
MRRFKLFIAFVGFSVVTFLLTLPLFATGAPSSKCNPAGGCWSPCAAQSSAPGTSLETIGASQLSQCSPRPMSSCSGSSYGVCGVVYFYLSNNCDPTTIEDSYYEYGAYC